MIAKVSFPPTRQLFLHSLRNPKNSFSNLRYSFRVNLGLWVVSRTFRFRGFGGFIQSDLHLSHDTSETITFRDPTIGGVGVVVVVVVSCDS